MTYWRMQLHPNEPECSAEYAYQSLSAGFIGLDFLEDVGDLRRTAQQHLPGGQRDYWAFAHEMAVDDHVLIIAHHFPVAIATIAGDYNYIGEPEPELGVWFRHFRRIKNVRYYADRITNAHAWQQTTMTDTISPLRDPNSISYQLIASWP